MVNILSSSNPVRVKDLADPGTDTMALPSSPGQSMTEKLYEMMKESTTSPGGCVQVRSMVVLVLKVDRRLAGVEARMTGEWISAKAVHVYSWMSLTHAYDPISSVSLVTGTGEATRSVGTGSISTTVVITRRSTLIKIYQHDMDRIIGECSKPTLLNHVN